MKFPGILEAGKANGVLTEAKYVKGSYIVCATKKDRDTIPCGVRIIGTKIYIASEQKEYRWDGTKWVELATDLPSLPQDTKIYGIQNGQWVELDIDYLNNQITNLNTEVENIKANETNLQNQIEYNTNFVNYLNAEVNKKANIEDIPTKLSQLENDSNFITLEVASNEFASKEDFNSLTETVNNISDEVNNINSELSTIQDSITTLNNEVVKYTLFTTPEETVVINKIGNSVDIDDPTTPSLSPNENTVITQVNRKTIQLDNYDSISGLDTEGDNHNLITITKQNITDFGDKGLHLNLNTKDNITVNNGDVLLTTKDKEELEQKIDAIQPGGSYTKEEIDEKFNEYVTLEVYNQDKVLFETSLDSKQDKLIDKVNIKTINGQSILGSGNLNIEGGGGSSYILPIATTIELGGIKSGTYESEEGITRSVVVDPDTGLATVRIPTLEQSTDQQDIVDILNSGNIPGVNKLVINGGDATN